MISDDIIYVGLLLVSIAFGKITRQIPNTQARKWTSSLFGLGKFFFRCLVTLSFVYYLILIFFWAKMLGFGDKIHIFCQLTYEEGLK